MFVSFTLVLRLYLPINSGLKDNKPHTWTSNPKRNHRGSQQLWLSPKKSLQMLLSLLWIVSKRLGVQELCSQFIALLFVISEFSLTVTLTSIPIIQMPQRKQTWGGAFEFLIIFFLKNIYSVLSTKMNCLTSLCTKPWERYFIIPISHMMKVSQTY